MDTKPIRELIEISKSLKCTCEPTQREFLEKIATAEAALAAGDNALAGPPTDLDALQGGIPADEDVDAFLKEIYDAREPCAEALRLADELSWAVLHEADRGLWAKSGTIKELSDAARKYRKTRGLGSV